ncbi:MAG: hypothetical protein JSU95_05530 [Betaproteobacteria bacterium]|nr:MAG: hypothetical protein JSU95_05530 [Betaproteobacteria bacterium]
MASRGCFITEFPTGQFQMLTTLRLVIGAALLWFAASAGAQEFDGLDAMSLAKGKKVETDCSITWKNPKDGKVYCFANARNQFMFTQNTKTFVPRAQQTFESN